MRWELTRHYQLIIQHMQTRFTPTTNHFVNSFARKQLVVQRMNTLVIHSGAFILRGITHGRRIKITPKKLHDRTTSRFENDASARPPNLYLASRDLHLWSTDPQSRPFPALAPWTTCANWHQNRFIHFQNIVITITNERCSLMRDGQTPSKSYRKKQWISNTIKHNKQTQ